MLRKDLLIHKTKTLLNEFLNPMLGRLDKPRQRFLRQTVRAILFSGSLVVMELCKWVRDKRLFSLTSRFRKTVRFQYYRLLDGIQEFIRLNPNEFLKPPPTIRKNG